MSLAELLERLLKTRESVFRLECGQNYDVATEAVEFRRFLTDGERGVFPNVSAWVDESVVRGGRLRAGDWAGARGGRALVGLSAVRVRVDLRRDRPRG
ncbi:DUF6879 family protein [Actinokineospora sp. 24-640]